MQEAYAQIVRFVLELCSQIPQLRFEFETWLPCGHTVQTFNSDGHKL